MDTTRNRFGFAADWLTAGALLAGTIVVAALVVRELRTPPHELSPSGAADVLSSAAAVIPPEAVSVPSLTVGVDEIKVGDTMANALARLTTLTTSSQGLRLVRQATERGPLGPREIRWYELSGTGFILIFEAFERRGEPRVAAIYFI